MASKTTPQEMIELQFVEEQFNGVADFEAFLQGIINNQEGLLAGRIGSSTFDSTNPAIVAQVKRASVCVVAAELLQRRINRLSGNVDADTALLIRTLQTAKTDYTKEAEEKISRLISSGASADSGNYAGGVLTSSGNDEDLVRLWPVGGSV